jgi:hypothetical protein
MKQMLVAHGGFSDEKIETAAKDVVAGRKEAMAALADIIRERNGIAGGAGKA